MAEIPIFVYLILLAMLIISPVMANVAKYSWKSRLWTGIFALLGIISLFTLAVIFFTQ